MNDSDTSFIDSAIEQARRCVPEDDRIHPKVGVVVVKDSMVVTSAHRGELTPGEHAEYTALERKLCSHSIAGATVYTTLEPCTHRNPPKIPCADRLVERRVAKVVVGILDPNPNIRGNGFFALRKGGIAVELFPVDRMMMVEELNRDFLRQFYAPREFVDGSLPDPNTKAKARRKARRQRPKPAIHWTKTGALFWLANDVMWTKMMVRFSTKNRILEGLLSSHENALALGFGKTYVDTELTRLTQAVQLASENQLPRQEIFQALEAVKQYAASRAEDYQFRRSRSR